MRQLGPVLAALLAVAAMPALAQSVVVKPRPLNCNFGPVGKTYGLTEWQVYSCDDNRTVVVLAAPGNPAKPFYFMFSPGETGYQLSGEGTGRQSATRAAFAELKTLTDQDIAALVEETRQR